MKKHKIKICSQYHGDIFYVRVDDTLIGYHYYDDGELTKNNAEKKYLSAVIKPFRDRVTHIAKVEEDIHWFYWIMIRVDIGFLDDYYEFCLPPFEETSSMYKNMEVGKEYTLKDLGL